MPSRKPSFVLPASLTLADRSWLVHCLRAQDATQEHFPRKVNCVAGSPPYYRQRDYGLGAGQLGWEDTPEEYVSNLVSIFVHLRQFVHESATWWVNIGDSYAGSGGPGGDYLGEGKRAGQWDADMKAAGRKRPTGDLKPKDLIGVPWMFAFAMRKAGFWVRADNIWSKDHLMPQGAKDRPTISHEYVFLFSTSKHYHYDWTAVAEPGTDGESLRSIRSVWDFTVSRFRGKHYATYPLDIPARCIEAGTSVAGVCPVCSAPLSRLEQKLGLSAWEEMEASAGRPITFNEVADNHSMKQGKVGSGGGAKLLSGGSATMRAPKRETVGWAPTCSHPEAASPVSALVLDPFNGSGTTAEAALTLGRSYVGFEPSLEYAKATEARMRGLGVIASNGGVSY